MPAQYVGPLTAAQVDGAALTNSTVPTSILPGQAKPTITAGFIDVAGKSFRVRAFGRISTLTAAPGTLTLDLRFGSIVIANGGAMTLSTSAKTNVTWDMEWLLAARAVGAVTAANFMHAGRWTSEAAGATTVAGEAKTILLPQSAPAVGSGFDSTVQQQWDMFATWSIANAANSIQCHGFAIESLN
jgi:hypothetical protein